MNLRCVMTLPLDQTVYVARLAYHVNDMLHDPTRGPQDIGYILNKFELRMARKKLAELVDARNWLLVRGELEGQWVQCANAHDNYSDDPKGENWRLETFIGRQFWLCSPKCAIEWRERMLKQLLNPVQHIEMTFEGGRKTIMHTTGRSQEDGTPQTAEVHAA